MKTPCYSGCQRGTQAPPGRLLDRPDRRLAAPLWGRLAGPGVLLVNLGTPDAPRTPEVRRYLREFLSDPRGLDINPIGRAALLNLIILPLRPRKSAEAYREVWTEEGSPLLVHGKALAAGVQERLPEAEVVLAMRYGNPSISSGIQRLVDRGARQLLVLPLYLRAKTARRDLGSQIRVS